jgi:hypothetical protein
VTDVPGLSAAHEAARVATNNILFGPRVSIQTIVRTVREESVKAAAPVIAKAVTEVQSNIE